MWLAINATFAALQFVAAGAAAYFGLRGCCLQFLANTVVHAALFCRAAGSGC